MKIGIDVSQVVYGTGVSRYTANLVRELLTIDSEDTFVVYGGALRRMPDLRIFLDSLPAKRTKKIAIPLSPSMADFIWNRVHRLSIERIIGNVDVLHTSDWAEPPSKRAVKVTTIHDLSPIKFSEVTQKRIVQVHTQKLVWVKKESTRIIVPSTTIKRDLIDMGFQKDRIAVIYEAADSIYKPATKEAIAEVKRKYDINQNYLLSVGINQRKNTKRIIEAFAKIKKDMPIQLVLIGKPWSEVPNVAGITVLGHVDDVDMPALYSGATALVYPSLYEGFGLPILESFACKTPVVTSNIGSMAEIGKGAAVLVDPESVESIVKGIQAVIKNRNTYILKGMRRVKEFSWKKAARETLKVYKERLEN